MRISRIAKFLLALIVTCLLIAAFNIAATFALEPYGTKSEIAWTEFDAQEEIDTVFVGTSISARSLDPNAFDDHYKTHSYNLSTPNQTLEESFIGLQTAYDRFHVKHAVIALEYTCLQTGLANNPGDAFMTKRASVVSLPDTLKADWWLLVNKGAAQQSSSLNTPFPWISNHINFTMSELKENVTLKTDGSGMIDAAEALDPGWKYLGKGYGNYESELDYNSSMVSLFGEQEHLDTFTFDQSKIDTLNDMCAYCAKNDIELVIVAAPIPAYNIIAYADSFFDNEQVVRDILANYGIQYYDFTLAKPELFENSHSYFVDNTHLNAVGARAFDTSLMHYIDMLRANEDVSALFYSPEEYLSSIDYIDATTTKAKSTAAGIEITATAYAGPSVSVEYQYWVSYDSENWELVSDYSPQSTCTFLPRKHGKISVRACARKAGSNVDYDYFQDASVLY